MTLFTYAFCVECGRETIGGKGHECDPVVTRESMLARLVLNLQRRELIRVMAKAKRRETMSIASMPA